MRLHQLWKKWQNEQLISNKTLDNSIAKMLCCFYMYTPKFDYKPLTRVEINGKRRYASPDGDQLPSVTTILDATKPAERVKQLNEWKKRMGTERAQQITTEAANRGTKMHTFLEQYVKQGTMPEKPGNPFHQPSWAMADTVISNGLKNCNEFWGIEIQLYFPKVYAGTTDCCGLHLQEESIMDFKQSNKPKKREWIDDYFMQLCAYANAHNEVYGTKIQRGVVMMCVKPEVDIRGQITTQPQYQEFIIEGSEFQKYNDLWWRRVEQYYLMQ
jgi:hypothetical protein